MNKDDEYRKAAAHAQAMAERSMLAAPLTNLLQNTVQRWTSPIQTLRNLGYRTRGEIEQEWQALLTLHDRQASRPKRKRTTRRIKLASKQSNPSSKKRAEGG